MPEIEDKTQKLLAALWLKNRPLIEERLATLDTAAAAAAQGSLSALSREEAAGCAHKLAGSVGMYGFEQGTALARQLELLFNSAAPDPADLRRLVAELRAVLFPQG